MDYEKIQIPRTGEKIAAAKEGRLVVPDNPIIPYIEGDGTGPDITRASMMVWDAAVDTAYKGKRRISWMEVFAGEKANQVYGREICLPDETVQALGEYIVSITGPLTTPVGGGFRSLNVTLRQKMDLYVCLRPVRWFEGVPSPVKHPELTNMVVFRENTEDIYAGIEWAAGTPEAKKLMGFLQKEMGVSKKIRFPETSGLGIKPISKEGSQRLIKAAIEYAVRKQLPSVTLVHKGNIMKYTEGAFLSWGYELVRQQMSHVAVTWEDCGGKPPAGKVLVKDVIADAFLQQILTRPAEYSVIATMNLNGDYISDALAACVGGIGIAPGGNINYDTGTAVFEATHGTAPKYANQDKVNPGSLLLSGAMMLEHMGWQEAADLVVKGMNETIRARTVTYDFARLTEGAREVKCSEFGRKIAECIRSAKK